MDAKILSRYILEARKWYNINLPNIVPDDEDIANTISDFLEDDFGVTVNDDIYNKILQYIKHGVDKE